MAFCGQCGKELAPESRFCQQCGAPVITPSTAPTPRPDGERRHLTVLFCDLVGSTAIADQMDPEDWRDTLLRFQQEMIGEIERAGGYVAQHLGDGLLVYFGYPRAREDDTERAMRCGLALVTATRALNPELRSLYDVELDLRVGVHAGPVVVGEVGGTRRETLAIGSTANLASRVQSQAEPGTVLATASTLRGLEQRFVLRDTGLHALKGFEQPVRLFTVVEPSGTRDRFEFSGQDLAPFIGRAHELEVLRNCFDEAAAGRGQIVAISGEPGMGKSRLTHAFQRSLEHTDARWVQCGAAAYDRDSPLLPWLQLQRELLGIGSGTTDEARLEGLADAVAAEGLVPEAVVPFFATLHGIPLAPPYALPALGPLGIRKRSLALLVDWLINLAREEPVVLLVEDLHWLDPSSVELLGLLLERVRASRFLLLLTYRPDFEPPWQVPATITRLPLDKLAHEELRCLVEQVAPAASLTDEWLDRIVNRSDGVPLFAEELARTFAEADERQRTSAALSIPETLEDSLMARLEQTDAVKQVTQLASVVGREFSEDLLVGLWQGDPAILRNGLRDAERARLLVRRDDGPGPVYLFRHALIRDAAYNTLLRKTRRHHHQAVAQNLRDRFPATVRDQPELLAYHLMEAGEEDAAIDAWRNAGALAMTRAAYQEAIRHLRQARSLLAKRSGDARELDVVQMLGGALVFGRGWANAETREAWEAAATLCDPEREPLRAGIIACGLGDHYVDSAVELEKALPLFEGLVESGLRHQLPLLVIAGHQGAAIPLRYLGRYPEARAHLDAGLAIYDPAQHRFLEAGFHEDKGISLLAWSAWLNWDVGAVERAREDARRGLELAQATGNPFAAALVGSWGGCVEVFSCNWERAIELGSRAANLAADHGFAMLEPMGRLAELAGRSVAEGMAEATDLFRLEMGKMAATGNQLGGAEVLGVLSNLELEKGHPTEALGAAEFGLGLSAALGQPWCIAWLLTLKARALMAGASADPAAARTTGEELLRNAVDMARAQGARSYELRAATCLAELLREDARGSQAAQILGTALAGFDSTFDSVELRRARGLLAALQ